jgi:hypothetical protein
MRGLINENVFAMMACPCLDNLQDQCDFNVSS